MFDEKYLTNQKLTYIVEEMNDLGKQIDDLIHEESYKEALMLALELHDITKSHFKASHIYRAFTSVRIGFLYFIMGIWSESKSELLKAERIFQVYKEEYPLDLFEVTHILYKLAISLGDHEAIIRNGQNLLQDESLNLKLRIRIYISLAKEYIFGTTKNHQLADRYLKKVKSILETNNLIEGVEYADVLFLLAHYHSQIEENELALKFIGELDGVIHHENIPVTKAYRLRRSTEHLKKVIKNIGLMHQTDNLTSEEAIELLFLDDDRVN